ncbi:GNAT family N-acetyltransferase [Chromobacterium subtsugae]|uniref:GNAT family N-acetyltransferase n=2 Tax=Chromobacterium subtsugae TaxID=251747 RepID=A0ABS7FAB2_9NEIS|nr:MULTISPECIES: GNAT family N-acetyltransferase [Chromobacterium]KUM01736.1 effector protein [Chromobacterium subtsugae]KZE83289.1 effector protein [Chromobacterium sp. F49]MBW7565244.1 GNAT family N-acetyltransferase [Chromobacterium subtsugae]MBW8286228.1 GNAT family N-acetyltransferase [Chromobacterium subtsugae]OBU87868.1 effector protein [Chromobacterium subtsugae]
MANRIAWHCHGFDGFTPLALYQVLQLRDRVFVLEQQSLYGDVDGVDTHCLHLSGRDEAGRLLAYARLIAPGEKYPDAAAIGRVVVEPAARGQGLGKALLAQAVAQCQARYPGRAIMLSAQQDASAMYAAFDFEPVSEPYDDGGILHLDMRREG